MSLKNEFLRNERTTSKIIRVICNQEIGKINFYFFIRRTYFVGNVNLSLREFAKFENQIWK